MHYYFPTDILGNIYNIAVKVEKNAELNTTYNKVYELAFFVKLLSGPWFDVNLLFSPEKLYNNM